MKFVTATAMFLAMTATGFAATLTEKECNRVPLFQQFEYVAKGLCDFDLNSNGFVGDATVKSNPDKNPDNDNDNDDGDGDTDTDTDKSKGNNGHGNDPDHNDNSNPGKSNDPNDNTDADGVPGNGKNK